MRSKPIRWKILAICGWVFGRRAVMRTAAEHLRRVGDAGRDRVEHGAVLLEDLLDRGAEQVLPAWKWL